MNFVKLPDFPEFNLDDVFMIKVYSGYYYHGAKHEYHNPWNFKHMDKKYRQRWYIDQFKWKNFWNKLLGKPLIWPKRSFPLRHKAGYIQLVRTGDEPFKLVFGKKESDEYILKMADRIREAMKIKDI